MCGSQNKVPQQQECWSKFKETNPDNFRTPILEDQRAALDQQGIFGGGGQGGPADTPVRRNQRGQQLQRGAGRNNRRDGGPMNMQQQQGRFPVSWIKNISLVIFDGNCYFTIKQL